MERAFFSMRSLPPIAAIAITLAACGGTETGLNGQLNPVFCADGAATNACAPGCRSVDLDRDQCADRCEVPACETFAPVVCPGGAMPVDSDGDGCARECPNPSGSFCGGIAGIQCGVGQYCDFPLETQCGSGDQAGTCLTIPEVCTDIYAPVCGCDGQTYGNECDAHASGTSVAHWGGCRPTVCPAVAFLCTSDTHPADTDGDGCVDACVPNGGSCGGLTPTGSPTCGATEYCDYALGDLCGAADAPGICRPRPEACTTQYEPVCGCNGKTYGNACVAASYGTGVSHYGACDVVCPAYYPQCPGNATPIDADHDGCALECPTIP